MSIIRSAVYLNRVSNAHSAVGLLKLEAQRAAQLVEFENAHKEGLDAAFNRLYKAAASGSVLMLLKPDDFLMKEEIQNYMRSLGFAYDPRYGGEYTIEWWHAKDTSDEKDKCDELK
jgi:hypothetical protein